MRHFALRLLLAAAVLGLVSGAARAAMLGDASVSYRALRTVTVDGRSYSGPVFHRPGHQRHEQDLLGMHEIFLLDTAQARGYLVLPSVKTFVEFPFPPLMAELDSPDLLTHPAGPDTIAGIATIKYRIDHTAQDGSRADGFLWLSQAGILMKLEISVTRAHGGRPMAIAMALSQVALGPVDPGLFALPPGLVQLPADALGPLLGGRPG
jgi:hypothetical protein